MSKDSKETELHFIKHYKKSMDKNPDNVERVLHCLQRLEKLRMNVNLLEQTGIGKTVANVRKLDGEAGRLARKLVQQWKEIVAKLESADKKKVSLSSKSSVEQSEGSTDGDAAADIKPVETTNGKSPKEVVEKKHVSSKTSRHHHHRSAFPSASSHTHDHSSKNHHHHSSKEKTKVLPEKSAISASTSHHTHKSSHHKNSNSSSHSNGESLKRKRDDDKPTESKDSLKEEKTHKKPKNDTEDHKEKHSSGSSRNKTKDSESLKKKSKEIKGDEFDGSTGLGFAEALAMFDIPSSSSKKKETPMADKIVFVKPSKKSSKDDKKKSDKPSTSSSANLKELRSPPKLLLEKPARLQPLPDIVKEIPADISIPEYRPTPLSSAVKEYINASIQGANSSGVSRHHMKPLNEAEILTESLSFSSKVNRTRVYSGNRQVKTVPAVFSLFEMCIKVLQENMDYITETGGVPFDIMKPVLEKARPEQLQEIEYYNPYLLEESDVLWESHVKKKFRARKRDEMETWREMFERCEKEDEEKLNRLTKNIKKSQEKAVSEVQKTRLAFVDSMVKPPRNVMRKQEIYGTNSMLVSSPAARTDALKHLAPNIAVAGDVRLRVAAGIRDDAQNFGRPRPLKRAPMMQKLMSKMKR